MLSNIVYVSQRATHCTDEEIQKILDSCIRNNKTINITGVLLYSDNYFVQYIEGKYSEIMALYDKIKGDNRHKNPVLISCTPTSQRLFPSWQMGAKKFNTGSISFDTNINDQDKEVFHDILQGKTEHSKHAVSLIKKFFK